MLGAVLGHFDLIGRGHVSVLYGWLGRAKITVTAINISNTIHETVAATKKTASLTLCRRASMTGYPKTKEPVMDADAMKSNSTTKICMIVCNEV